MVWTPTTNQNFAGGASTITWGTSPNTGIPSSITNPSSLKPWQQLTPPNTAVWSTTAWLSKPVGYEWAVKPIYTPWVSRIDSSGKDIAGTVWPLAKPAVPLATVPTTPATTWTTPTAQTWTVAPTNWQLTNDQNQQVAQGLDSNILDDTNNFANLWISEADFNNLPPDVRIKALEEKAAGVQQSEAIRKMTESALINERQKQYAQTQEANRLEQESINANLAGVQASQRLKDASQNLSNLKQNIGFLGTWGRPVKSAASLDAMQNNISEAQTTFQIMKNTEDQFAKLRGLQSEWQAKQFEENMARLDDQLKQQTTSLFLKARMETDQAFKKWLLDSPKKQLEFHQKMLSMVDDSLEGINQAQLAQYWALIEAGKTYAEQIKTQTEREQKLADEQRAGARKTDMERSKALWILLDWNGDPILSSGGQEIPVPKDLPPWVTTIRDEEEWAIYIPKLNPDGSVGYDKIKVWTPKPKEENTGTWSVTEDADGNKILFNNKTGATKPFNPTTNNTPTDGIDLSKPVTGKDASNLILSGNTQQLANEMVEWKAYSCWTRSQCWEWYNDAVGTKNWTHVWNTYADKTQFVDPTITQGQPWMWVVFNPWGDYAGNWHIGVLSSWPYEKNWVTGYDMISANYIGAKDKLSKQFVPESKIVSTWGGFIPTKIVETPVEQPKKNAPVEDYALYWLAKKLIETGWFEPKDVTALGYNLKTFKDKAMDLYTEGKTKELEWYWAKLDDIQTFLSAAPKKKEDAMAWLGEIKTVLQDVQSYRDMAKDAWWAELSDWSGKGDKLEQVKNKIALQLKEVEKLWVLNGKDYDILLTQIPSAVSIKRWFGLGAPISDLIDTFEQGLLNRVNTNLKPIWVSYAGLEQGTPEQEAAAAEYLKSKNL